MSEGPKASFESRARHFAELMVGWPSVTGSADEALFADRLRAELAGWDVFRANPGDLIKVPAPGVHDRASIMALARGEGSATVILAGHFDTVSIDDYGELADLAGEPEALRRALVAKLRASGADPQALDDLASGRFLPGRGMLDMKSGLAAGLAVLERFAATPERRGNLLLVACPDEEENSSGIRSVAEVLPGFLAENGLDARLTINLDAICDNEDGAAGRVVAMGCIGKLLLSALVVGKEAHACYPLDGVNAAYLAAELAVEMEYAPELGEIAERSLCSPPTVLGLKDLKPAYNVTIPARVWAFWNVLMHRRKAAEVIQIATEIAARAVRRAGERMSERAARTGIEPAAVWRDIPVLTYADLLTKVHARSQDFAADLSAVAADLAARHELDLPSRSRELTEFVWGRSGLDGPAVVLCIGGMPYPAIVWPDGLTSIESAIDAAVAEVSAAHGETVVKHPFFPAIADMSFVGAIDREDLRVVAANTPLWGSSITWPDASGTPLEVPAINVGPWGRDYHHWLERTNEGYTFRVLPDLVDAIARQVLNA